MSLNLVFKKTGVSGAARELSVDVDPSSTVAELKEQISAAVELSADNIRLVCAGRVWDNVATVASYNPSAGSIIHCLNNPTREVPNAAAQTLTVANPMQQMMSAAMPPSNSTDPFEQMQSQVQQQMMQNPEMMQQMMSSPMMQQMMSDPETVRGMMRMNPRMNQLMEQRPEIARMLEDPELMQNSMRMMANPELMREMTRNQDRAMGQLNVMPGGHQALARAHEEYMDPLMSAMSGGNGANGAVVPTYEDDAAAAPNNDALPNPWGAPTAVTAAPSSVPAPSTSHAPPLAPSSGQQEINAQPAPNPMQQMMQQMMSNPAMSPFGQQPSAAQPPPNPMQQMMQQMSNPATPPFGQQPNAAQPGANPMQQMMQQMMSNPAMMQQVMSMRQQMMQQQPHVEGQGNVGQPTGGLNPAPFSGGAGAGAGGFGASPGGNPFQQMMQQMNAGAAQGTGDVAPVPESVQRMRFASQLMQLANMGFTDESMCLRALAQHNGRLDSAIDVLLTGAID